jgi:hypothetical protein
MGGAELDSALTQLLVQTGAQAARLLDGRTAAVLAEVGATAEDDPGTLARLVEVAAAAAAAGGGLEDLMLATRRSVHVLRGSAVPGSVLQLRLDSARAGLAANLSAARHALAAAAQDEAVCAAAARTAIGGERDSATPEPPELPLPPALPADRRTDGQPALASLRPGGRPTRSGELAARALGPLGEPPQPATTPSPVRRSTPPAQHPSTPPGLQKAWANDLDTLHRLLTALRGRDRQHPGSGAG